MSILIIGATRGLGQSLLQSYAAKYPHKTIFGTSRDQSCNANKHTSKQEASNTVMIPKIDLSSESASSNLVQALRQSHNTDKANTPVKLETVIITAGYFATESFETGPCWSDEVKMYTISSIAPTFLVHALVSAGLIPSDHSAKIILVSSESGSITLRHAKEGGGNYAHHASKSALNMVGRLLSLDLQERGIAVGMVHPGFMRTEMTRGVGFDKYWDDGGAVTPDEAAKSLMGWVDDCFDIGMTGQYWAPRGPRDIGTAEETMGKGLATPLHLPW